MTSSPNPMWLSLAQSIVGHIIEERPFSPTVDLIKLLTLAEKNNLLFAVGQALEEKRPFPEPFEAKMQKAEAHSLGTNHLIGTLWPHFENASLSPLTLKTFLPFPYVDSNIDCICIPADKGSSYVEILLKNGFKWRKNLADIREPLKRMYTKIGKSSGYPDYHLHTAVSWNGIHYLDLQIVWESRQLIEVAGHSLWIPCATDELLIFAAHALFENKYITLHELIYLHFLNRAGIDWARVERLTKEKQWWDGLVWVLSLAQTLSQALNIQLETPFAETAVEIDDNWHLPYQLPLSKTMRIGWQKLKADVQVGNIQTAPRQLFSYALVDPFWMMRKSRRKCQLQGRP